MQKIKLIFLLRREVFSLYCSWTPETFFAAVKKFPSQRTLGRRTREIP